MTVLDVNKVVAYWANMAEEDVSVARHLFRVKRFTHALFFCHLALEKTLKAIVVKKTKDHAPWTHNLPFLAGRASLTLDKTDMEFLAEMTRWNLEARYPSDVEALKKGATNLKAQKEFKRTEEFIIWLRRQL